jgi:membrane dipeptidase
MRWRTLPAAAVGAGLGAVGVRASGRAASALIERRVNRTFGPADAPVSDAARDVHSRLAIVDLHADSLLWGRDLVRRGQRGHVDVPRLIEGRVALQVLAASTKVSRHIRLEDNEDWGDDVRWLAVAQGWPPSTWFRLLPRALYLARRAHQLEARSFGRFALISTRAQLEARVGDGFTGGSTAGLLAIEGAHALDGELPNLDVLFDAGYRVFGLAHFFDNAFAGSVHGRKTGLSPAGRELVGRAEALGMVIDVSHASPTAVADVLAMATRPVVASHTGLRGVADNVRNLSDEHARGIAATGGVMGIGFWPRAAGGRGVDWIVRSIRYAVDVAGRDHVALGSDWDGAVAVPFDAAGVVRLTDGLLGAGFDEPGIAAIMGGNALRVFREVLP